VNRSVMAIEFTGVILRRLSAARKAASTIII